MELSGYPVKVLAVVSKLDRGGLESRLMDIIRHLNRAKICIDIYTYHLEKGVMDDEACKCGCKIYYNETVTVHNMFSYVDYFENFLLEHPEYKIVHAHQDAWCSVFCKGAFKAGVPVRIAHSRTAIEIHSIKDVVKDIIKIPTAKYATDLFAVSDKAAEWLYGKRRVRNGEVRIWKNAIDCKKFIYNEDIRETVRNELNLEDEVVVMHVGNFIKAKNHEFIIEVFEEFLKNKCDAKLVLIGTDTVENNLEKIKNIVKDKKIEDNVIFLGIRDDVPNLLQAADVFLFPSLFEGLPGAVVEAQAAGLPCIISKNITSEVCILSTTIQLDLREPIETWAYYLEKLLTSKRENTYSKMVAAGYDITTLVDELEKFYIEKGKQNELV